MSISPVWHTASPKEAGAILQRGGVIVAPAEGVYGLCCRCDDEAALQRLLSIKKRPAAKGFIVIAASVQELEPFAALDAVPPAAQDLMRSLWPGPFTFVVAAAPGALPLLHGEHDTLAVRVSAFEPLRALVVAAGVPLVSTSANISGAAPSAQLDDLAPEIQEQVDGVLTLPCGGLAGATSIYDCLSGELLRQGPQWPQLTGSSS
ncbi:MAG: threonylcarbamoyl-AMP synthase [Succinivibrio sp.]|nr:threonylcarbamoyl-AMP synthase [Succinivibrio sp.]